MPAKLPTADRVIEQLASRSHGVVTRRELLEAGITRAEIESRLRKGGLLREYRGVFRVGHRAPSVEARYLTAVCAAGAGALLAGRAAAYLYGLIKGSPPPAEVITVGKRRLAGVRTRDTRRIDPRDAATYVGIPITTVPRTLVDLAGVLDAEALGGACHEAGIKYRVTPAQVRLVIDRRPNTPGVQQLWRILDGDDPVTISRLERRFVKLIRDAGLPLPVTNKPAGGRRVDCRWPELKLTVELDSYRYHRSRYAWERDRRREREARARGDEFRRYTYGDVYEEADATLAELRRLLAS
jgi:hypothetical protein